MPTIYVSPKYKHIIMIPCKTGSITVDYMLGRCNNYNWHSVFIGKEITSTTDILWDYLDHNIYSKYKTILMIRNPIEWIISGYRCMQIKENKNQNYPSTFRNHLLSIIKNDIDCIYWKSHCYWQPLDYYNDNFSIFKLEEFDKFKKYLDKTCASDYKKYENYQFNTNTEVKYPILDQIDVALIKKLAKKHNKIGKYDLKETINKYRIKYGEK